MKIKNLTVKQLMKKNVANSKVMQNLAYGAAKRKVDTLKKELLKELNDHPVTKEIEQGPMGMNSSLLGGYGNFFGFLGFTPSQKPVQIIREGFEKFIQVEKKPRLNKLSQKSFEWEFPIRYPSAQEIYAATPLTWTTQSWVKGVERGISNFVNTLFGANENSRSGVAIQSERKLNLVNFSPTPYITPMLQRFKTKLK
jgi:hypothetical protein|tara:strand:+ start:439 stop:1029 length:591 start_codon:yes stop_codon:yes gene_type:complete